VKTLGELCGRVEKEPCVLATVIATEGSSPSEASMRMLVGREGRVAGTIGGGHVEASVEAKAREVLDSGRPEVMSFTLDDDVADEGGLICGGTVRILVERVQPPATWAREAHDAAQYGRRGVLVARIGEKSVDHRFLAGDEAAPYLPSEEARFEDGLFIEPLVMPRCIIVGAGHVGRAVARIASVAGYRVCVVEDREDQAQKARDLADTVVTAELEQGFADLDAGPDDFVVVMTRGHGLDLRCVRAALKSPARYVGMLASRKKAGTIREALEKEGVDTSKRLHAPIGLDLAAKSAGEIAVSVVAQLIKVRRLGRGDR
jgi:xanthine dehydrogenase accessory factor